MLISIYMICSVIRKLMNTSIMPLLIIGEDLVFFSPMHSVIIITSSIKAF